MSSSVLPMFSSKSFILSGLTFRSLIHLSLTLCMVLGNVLISFFYMQLSSLPAPCIEEAVFPPLYILVSFAKNKVPTRAWVHFCTFYLVSVQFSSVAQSCPTLCDPMDCSTPGLLIRHQLPEFTQPSHPLSSPSPLALNLSQDQGFFQ